LTVESVTVQSADVGTWEIASVSSGGGQMMDDATGDDNATTGDTGEDNATTGDDTDTTGNDTDATGDDNATDAGDEEDGI
jgi:hypothetical protein